MKNILTIDVEDYFMASVFKEHVKPSNWDKYQLRVKENIKPILNLLKQTKNKATFFFVGWIADKYPDIVKEVFDSGHEIASHGFYHQLVYEQSDLEFREDIKKTKYLLEKITGSLIVGYRAPSYSITKKSQWAIGLLVAEGYKYDSSFFPIIHDKGGMPNAPRFPFILNYLGNEIIEIPLSTFRFLNLNFPVAGGGYFRILPYFMFNKTINFLNSVEKKPFVMYFHPWEIDYLQPEIVDLSNFNKFRHYYGLRHTLKKIERALHDFEFCPIIDFILTKHEFANRINC